MPLNRAILFACLCLCIGLLASAIAGTETFDTTGFGGDNVWKTGSFTGSQQVVWSFANARGIPSVYEGNPAIALRGSPKGWMQSSVITGGVGRVSAAFKQGSGNSLDCDVRVNDIIVGNYRSSGASGVVEVVSFDAFDRENRMPFTNEFRLTVSNRVVAAGVAAIDDLEWSPFRLFVRLDKSGTNIAWNGVEFDVAAEVYDVGQNWNGSWLVPEEFSGTVSDTNGLQMTIIPGPEDIGRTLDFSFVARDVADETVTSHACIALKVGEAPSPRFVNFEGASFNYNSTTGAMINLNGMNWSFVNVRTSLSDDTKIDSVSARFQHVATDSPAIMESVEPFSGIGSISLHFAYYGSNRTVAFSTQVKSLDDENWNELPNGSFNARGHGNISNCVFIVDVNRSDELFFRIVTTGNAGEIANIDNIRVREYGDTLAHMGWYGDTNIPIGRISKLDFKVLNRDGHGQEWSSVLLPENPNGRFETNFARQLMFQFAPVSSNEWGVYSVAAAAQLAGEYSGSTSIAVRVVSPPRFDLCPLSSNVVATNVVDVRVTNALMHAGGTEWTTAWIVQPPFFNAHSVSNKSQFRIGAGTTLADVGTHSIKAVLTDLGTGVASTGEVVVVVRSSGGTGAITNESYSIIAFGGSQLVVSGKVGRIFTPFGTTNMLGCASDMSWFWSGGAITNSDGNPVVLDLPSHSLPKAFFGVKVGEVP